MMRHVRWAILIGELVLLALALAVPRADLPQTAFDEADAPVNQATVSVVLSCRTALTGVRAAATAISAINPQPSRPSVSMAAYEMSPEPDLSRRSLPAFLSTFLI